jgi:hypothetical protein
VNGGPSRQDLAFAAFARIETKIDLLVGIMRSNGFHAVAAEDDARSQYGDVKIAMQMKSWRGQQYKGGRASECPSDFLLAYADMLESIALRTMAKPNERDDTEKLKYARFNLKDAALCRAWAAINKGKPAGQQKAQEALTGWDDGAPTAPPTPVSAGVPTDAWAADNGAADW